MTDRPEAWTDLLDVVAHDLKTPITAVKGYLELIEQAGELNEAQQGYADRAYAGLRRMEQLVMMLLDLTWIDADKPLDLRAVDLTRLTEEAAMLQEGVAARRDIRIELKLTPGVGTIQADQRRLSQVLNNLISNAIKYNRDTGLIELTGDGDPNQVWLSVRDTGIGIAPDEIDEIFTRFYRARGSRATRTEGTGLGLSIVKAIVEKHGGSIRVESEPGVGSTFTVTLLRQPHAREGSDPQQPVDQPPRRAERSERFDMKFSPTSSSEEQDSVDDDLQESEEIDRHDHDDDRI